VNNPTWAEKNDRVPGTKFSLTEYRKYSTRTSNLITVLVPKYKYSKVTIVFNKLIKLSIVNFAYGNRLTVLSTSTWQVLSTHQYCTYLSTQYTVLST
jgi:hypothetical protein